MLLQTKVRVAQTLLSVLVMLGTAANHFTSFTSPNGAI